MSVKVYIDTADWWIGYYRGPNHHYVCVVPLVVIRWNRRGPGDAEPISLGEWREGDVALDCTDFVWRRFESGWRTYPRDRGVQYGDTSIMALGPLTRLDCVPAEVDRLGAVPSEVAQSLRAQDVAS